MPIMYSYEKVIYWEEFIIKSEANIMYPFILFLQPIVGSTYIMFQWQTVFCEGTVYTNPW